MPPIKEDLRVQVEAIEAGLPGLKVSGCKCKGISALHGLHVNVASPVTHITVEVH